MAWYVSMCRDCIERLRDGGEKLEVLNEDRGGVCHNCGQEDGVIYFVTWE